MNSTPPEMVRKCSFMDPETEKTLYRTKIAFYEAQRLMEETDQCAWSLNADVNAQSRNADANAGELEINLTNSVAMFDKTDTYVGPSAHEAEHFTFTTPLNLQNLSVQVNSIANASVPVVTQILIIGHSFVNRLKNKLNSLARYNSTSIREEMDLARSNISPWIHGKPGACIKDIPTLKQQTEKNCNPDIIVLDIGQNDLCATTLTAAENAQQLVIQAKLLLSTGKVKMVMLCQVTYKTKLKKSTKDYAQFLDDVDEFNYYIMKLTRKEHRIVTWKHKGMKDPEKDFTVDGTHPDTDHGLQKYRNSIMAACRAGKNMMEERETMSKTALKKLTTKRKKERREKRSKPRTETTVSSTVHIVQPSCKKQKTLHQKQCARLEPSEGGANFKPLATGNPFDWRKVFRRGLEKVNTDKKKQE